MKKPIFVIVALLLSALALTWAVAGCGDSSSDSSGADGGESSSLTKVAFIKKADAVCNAGNREQSAAIKAYSEEKPPKLKGESPAKALLLTVILPSIKSNIESLREMETPKGDKDNVQAIVVANEKSIEEAEKEPGRFLKAESKTTSFSKGTELSMQYGFKVCGQY